YGENSPRTGTAINNLGGFYLDQGNLTEAAKHFEKALAIKEKSLGANSEGLIKSMHNLAIVYERMKRSDDAKKLRDRVEALMKHKIQSSDKKDIDTMLHLADKLIVEKKHDDAEKLLDEALAIATAECGPKSLKTAQVLQFQAMCAQTKQEFDRATHLYISVL